MTESPRKRGSTGGGKRKGRGKVSTKTKDSLRVTKSERAGLALPVSRIHRFLKRGNYAKHIGDTGSVFLTAVLEYCVAEVLELAGNACKDNERKIISPRHIMLAIKNDDELSALLGKVHIPSGGVVPFIHRALMPDREKKSQEGKNCGRI